MLFHNRQEAGKLLAQKLLQYQNKNVVVYGIPRGGIIPASEIALQLHAPLDLIITRKIHHPQNAEYAVGAIAENGHISGVISELAAIDPYWLEQEIAAQQREIDRQRHVYLHGRDIISSKGKIAILVDDGAATGLTMHAAINELKQHHPQKIIVALPIVPQSTAFLLRAKIDTLVALEIPADSVFLGAVGAYYHDFSQVSDTQVKHALQLPTITSTKRKQTKKFLHL